MPRVSDRNLVLLGAEVTNRVIRSYAEFNGTDLTTFREGDEDLEAE